MGVRGAGRPRSSAGSDVRVGVGSGGDWIGTHQHNHGVSPLPNGVLSPGPGHMNGWIETKYPVESTPGLIGSVNGSANGSNGLGSNEFGDGEWRTNSSPG